jgi:hypothetical protein
LRDSRSVSTSAGFTGSGFAAGAAGETGLAGEPLTHAVASIGAGAPTSTLP